MTPGRRPAPRAQEAAPSPADAGTNLLVHDLKNLAGRLAMLCQNLATRYEDPVFKGTALDLLDDTALHLRRLAEELRDHDGRIMVKLRVDLNRILEEALRDTRPDLAGGVQVIHHCDPIPPIWGDAFLLRRAFACAIENALEAMKGSGTLAVRTALVRRRGRGRVIVEIGDTGPGMDEQFIREHLFRPFTTTKEDGLGLGLYTIRQVVGLHEGTVRISSATDAGTRVRFSFPCDRG
jgi:signal transduction histidine kinase